MGDRPFGLSLSKLGHNSGQAPFDWLRANGFGEPPTRGVSSN